MKQPSCLHGCCSVLWLSIILTLFPNAALAFDTITSNQPLKYNQTIASDVFELGFFSPGDSEKWYVGIWYKDVPDRTVVWVANRDNPLANSSGSLTIGKNGNLVLVDEASNPIWLSSNQTTSGGGNTVAQLLETGNLVVRVENDVDPRNYLWQSFDHPTDTLLPGMKLGWDAKTGLNRNVTSWRTHDDPSSGDYCFKLDIDGFPEFFLLDKQKPVYRSGPWNGLRFSGVPEMNASYNMSFNFVMDKDEVSYSFGLEEEILYSRLVVSSSGLLERYIWIESSQLWSRFWFARKDQCDSYMECGVFGVCDNNKSPVCECLTGFKPKNPQAWNLRDGSDGCIRTSKLSCPDDRFLPLKDMKLPESSGAFVDETESISDCEKACRRNCSCTAYANMDIRNGGSGCVIWAGGLLDLRQYALAEGGQALFVRVSAADLEATETTRSKNVSDKTGHTEMIVGITIGGGILLLGLSICFVWKKKRTQMARTQRIEHRGPRERSEDLLMNEGVIVNRRDYSGERVDDLELPLFDFSDLVIATGNFSDENKLGQGGFGIVYKGTLVDGQQIAVKRLSKNSGQGIEEFKNEVRLIARLQHRNLVRLLGCCIEIEEKMLIYEYMENKSLDFILFDKERCSILNWQTRFNIICGIARGLLYLHQDSRFRIIHRDLKASNILLDKEMNPRISDFGMARIFGRDQMEASTRRVVGTYGYMSPEYAMDGLFSVKSDVFSFGVLVMEIVTGKKNRGFYNADLQLNLLGHAWRQWREGKGLELIDPSIVNSYTPVEVIRCLQVGLLCVQERAEDRPTMSSIVLMLSSETANSMPQPKHPGFCLGRHQTETDSSSTKLDESCTVNQVTVTIMDGR